MKPGYKSTEAWGLAIAPTYATAKCPPWDAPWWTWIAYAVVTLALVAGSIAYAHYRTKLKTKGREET